MVPNAQGQPVDRPVPGQLGQRPSLAAQPTALPCDSAIDPVGTTGCRAATAAITIVGTETRHSTQHGALRLRTTVRGRVRTCKHGQRNLRSRYVTRSCSAGAKSGRARAPWGNHGSGVIAPVLG